MVILNHMILLILTSIALLLIALFRVIRHVEITPRSRIILSSLIIVLIGLDITAFIPALIDNGVWWYVLIINPVFSLVAMLYTLKSDRKLTPFFIPQIFTAFIGFYLSYVVMTQGVNLNIM